MSAAGGWSTIELLVTVKAYPNPSRTQSEAACIAGISREGEFIRLYPVPFRDLEGAQKFQKYHWIRVRVSSPRKDPRPETRRPDFSAIEIVSPEPLSTKYAWRERRDAVLPLRAHSLCDIQDAQRASGTSLGLFQPAEILDFEYTHEENPDWTPEERARLEAQDFFMTRERELLEKIPYKFHYVFRCHDCRNQNPHRLKIVDWELAQLFRTMREQAASIEECLSKVRDKWLGEICGDDKDTHFFVGNTLAHGNTFLVLGAFWPPKEKQLPLL